MSLIRGAFFTGLALASLCGAGGRRKLWDLDLSKLVGGQKDMAEFVWGARFSPDFIKRSSGAETKPSFEG